MDVAEKHLAELEKLLTAYASQSQPYLPRTGMEKEDDEGDYDHLSRFREWALSGRCGVSRNQQASVAQLKASDPAATAWVNANAGSGKTHVLVDRVIRLMLEGAEPSRIMCLTFTKAAAAEMANRLFERLAKWIAMDDAALADLLDKLGSPHADAPLLERARQLFTRALETPGGLKIQTIHAFCERVLQLFPVEAGVVPHFTMLDDRESLNLLQAARNKVLTEAKSEGGSHLGAALLDIANRVSADDFDRLLNQLLAKRANLRALFDGEGGLQQAESLLRSYMSPRTGSDAGGAAGRAHL